jgi:hypothetical protein
MCRRQSIGLNDHGRSRLAVVARRGHGDDVTAPHRVSNSDTASIHLIASRSADGSRPATAFATRRRTAFERASGTIRRSSRKPRARRRSRIALILSAAKATPISSVTRYTVTRDACRGNRDLSAKKLKLECYSASAAVGSAAVKTVYRTTNPADARIVTDVLAQHGLAASVLDEYTGAYGDPLGSVRVVVAPERERDARAVIAEWEAQRVPETEAPTAPAPGGWSPSAVVLVAAVIAVLLMVWYFGSFATD